MKTLLALIGLAVVLVIGIPLVLGLLGFAAAVLVKLVGIFLLLAVPILLVYLVVKCFVWLLGDREPGCRRDAPIPEDPECRGFHRRLARMDRRMERLEEILTDRV